MNEWDNTQGQPCHAQKSLQELLLLVISRQLQNYGAFPSLLRRPAGIGSAIWNPGYSLTSRTSSVQTPVHTSKQAATLTLPSATHFFQPVTTILNVTFYHEAFSNSSNCYIATFGLPFYFISSFLQQLWNLPRCFVSSASYQLGGFASFPYMAFSHFPTVDICCSKDGFIDRDMVANVYTLLILSWFRHDNS